MTRPRRPRLRGDLIRREFDDESAVYDPVEDRTIFLNASAAAVLKLCDGARTIEAIADEIGQRFQADGEQIRAGVDKALCDFSAWGFLDEPDHDSAE